MSYDLLPCFEEFVQIRDDPVPHFGSFVHTRYTFLPLFFFFNSCAPDVICFHFLSLVNLCTSDMFLMWYVHMFYDLVKQAIELQIKYDVTTLGLFYKT